MADEKKKDWTESVEQSLLHILSEIEKEDEGERGKMLRECKQNELYWHGFQYIFWDEGIQNFRIPTQESLEEAGTKQQAEFVYDYVVNIFKAHGLSIIAALSAEVPSIPFSPMDADSQKDIIAARKAEALGKIIHKYNKSKLIFYHALFTLFTSHFVAAYNYFERDEKYGSVDIPKFGMGKSSPDTWNCTDPECGFKTEMESMTCPDCSGPMQKTEGEEGLVNVGIETTHKGMEKLIIKGTLNLKIPTYASDQSACGYLIDYTDQHYAWIRYNYPDLDRDKIGERGTDNYERQVRITNTATTIPNTLLTFKRIWVRPWMYDTLDEEDANELKKKYPTGVYFAVVESGTVGELAEVREEKFDDHWTIAKGDLSRSVHGDPLGKSLVPMQDLENMVTNLLVETLEHSVPVSFADPEMLDFTTYSKQEVLPGALYPAKAGVQSGRRMEDYFATLKTSTLSKEGVDFDKIIESKGQFVVGAFPSIFGGPQTQGSKTLGEYQESRGYALQRLSIPYQLLFFWWADITYKSVKDYVTNMISDEKHSVKTQDGKFNGVMLLQEEFKDGRFSTLLPEAATDLPESFSQKKNTLQQIIQLNSDYLNQFLFSPENRRITLRYLGMEELSDLDSNQTMKQLAEIDELLNSEAVEDPNAVDMDGEVSAVPIEPDIDDHEIHLRVLKTFLSGEIGQEHKKQNPGGYKNCLIHAREHQLYLESMMQQQQATESVAPPDKSSNGNNGKPPVLSQNGKQSQGTE